MLTIKVVWSSNYMSQGTGYGVIAKNILPKLQKNTEHEFAHHCVSGLKNVMPFENKGVKIYGQTNRGGNLGVLDVPLVRQLEDADLVVGNFDMWAVSTQIQQAWDFPFVYYIPLDHDPLAPNQADVIKKSTKVIPYCKFGERVIKEGIDESKIYEPIYHGCAIDVFKPKDVSKKEVLGVPEDSFVCLVNKNNQGQRWAGERLLRAFKMFLKEDDVNESECFLFLNSNIQGNNAPNLGYLIQRLGLQNNVKMVNQAQQRYGLPEDTLADFYNSSDLLLNANRGEGFGLPIIESFSCGKPVIGSAYSSMPELIGEEEGETKRENIDEDFIETDRGLLVPTSDVFMSLGKHSWRREIHVDDIVASLKFAYHNREEMKKKGKNARQWVLDNDLDWSNIAEKWKQFFNQYEAEHFEEDERGIEWEKVGGEGSEHGGVGGFGK